MFACIANVSFCFDPFAHLVSAERLARVGTVRPSRKSLAALSGRIIILTATLEIYHTNTLLLFA